MYLYVLMISAPASYSVVTLLKGLKVDIDETADRKHGDGLIKNVEDVDALVADGD